MNNSIATFCPEDGWNVKIDKDGLCVHCGATACGSAVDELIIEMAQLRDELKATNNLIEQITTEGILDFKDDDMDMKDREIDHLIAEQERVNLFLEWLAAKGILESEYLEYVDMLEKESNNG